MNAQLESANQEPRTFVIVDDRERRFGVLAALSALDNVDVEIERLPLGDYLVAHDLLIERKTVVDTVGSVCDGRLFRQAYQLALSDYRTCLLFEGDFSRIDRHGLSRPAFQGTLITAALVFDLPILWSNSPAETAWLIITAARQLGRRNTHRPRHIRKKRAPSDRIQARMLEAIPGIGPAKANALLGEFGTMRTLAHASVDDLLDAQGIGPKMAKRIHWAFGED